MSIMELRAADLELELVATKYHIRLMTMRWTDTSCCLSA